jgi:nucleotide-binding universal stress UspA family protein
MFRNVIVGVDEHQGGRDAAALGTYLLERDGSMVQARVLVRDALMGRGASLEFEAAERLQAQEVHAAAGTDPQSSAELRCVYAPSVGRGLHELADAEQADLVVVGSCRRGLLGRVMIADDTSDALNGAPCALAIAPFGYADRRPATGGEIGVAYNGSSESKDALAVARSLAGEHGAKLSAFEAVSIPAHVTMAGATPHGEALEAIVSQARQRIAALGEIEPHAAYGLPAEELAIYSASLDLLVIGSRDYGPIGRLVHGSTSRQLARTARCPVLVLNRRARVMRQHDSDHAPQAAVAAAS